MKRLLLITALISLTVTCRERYDVPYEMPETGFLVVEGFIDTNGETAIRLSRTSKLDDRRIVFEQNASVRVEADDNSFFVLNEGDSGRYESASKQLDNSRQYRLHIKTASGKEYASNFSAPLPAPPIDSISWVRHRGGVEIFVNASSTTGTGYYRWEFDEDWEYRSHHVSSLEYFLGPGYRPQRPGQEVHVGWSDSATFRMDSSRHYCWQSRVSRALVLGSTQSLTQDRAYVSLVFIPEGAATLNWLYSINVKQTLISKEGYDFFSRMKKNTEMLGSIFDAQPSEIRGNVRNIADEAEVVIGHVDVTTVVQKRKFISVDELPGWNYLSGCDTTRVAANAPDDVLMNYAEGLIPTTPEEVNDDGTITAYLMAPAECVDCRLRGTNIKPPFWPW